MLQSEGTLWGRSRRNVSHIFQNRVNDSIDSIIPPLNQNPHPHWTRDLGLPPLQQVSTGENISSTQKLTGHYGFLGPRALSVCKLSLTAL